MMGAAGNVKRRIGLSPGLLSHSPRLEEMIDFRNLRKLAKNA
jgi:hypothetical protein